MLRPIRLRTFCRCWFLVAFILAGTPLPWAQEASRGAVKSSPRRVPPTRPSSGGPAAVVPLPVPAEITPAPAEVRETEPMVKPEPPVGTPLSGPQAWLEAQIALSRLGFSCGSIDGVVGPQTRAALQAFQARENLPTTGQLDEATRSYLVLTTPPLVEITLTTDDFARLQPLEPTWLGKSQQTGLEYTSVLERISERARANPKLIRQLNPSIDWDHVTLGAVVTVPDISTPRPEEPVAHLHIRLAERVLTARSASGRLLARYPVSIAREVAKRPVGELRVTVVVPDPDYTFDPEVFPESEEGKQLGRKLRLPPGPNNPVGLAWIGLDRPGYGIHGTPSPEQVGRTESHGCFRLANWDAVSLLSMAWVGLPVFIEP